MAALRILQLLEDMFLGATGLPVGGVESWSDLPHATYKAIVTSVEALLCQYLASWSVVSSGAPSQVALRKLVAVAAAVFADSVVRQRPQGVAPVMLRILEGVSLPFRSVREESASWELLRPRDLCARDAVLAYLARRSSCADILFAAEGTGKTCAAKDAVDTMHVSADGSTLSCVAKLVQLLGLPRVARTTLAYMNRTEAAQVTDSIAHAGYFAGDVLQQACPEFVAYRNVILETRWALHPSSMEIERKAFTEASMRPTVRLTGHDADENVAKITVTIAGATAYLEPEAATRSVTDVASYMPVAVDVSPDEREQCIMRAKTLHSFQDTLSQEDSERLLTLLSAPGLTIPLVADFFTVAKVACLFNTELRALLWGVLFQPGEWERLDRLNSVEADITTVPVSTADRWKLARAHGTLLAELQLAPHAVLMPLLDLFEHACSLCIGSADSAVVNVLLFVVQTVHRLERFSQHLLAQHEDARLAPSDSSRAVLENLTPKLQRLLRELAAPKLQVGCTHNVVVTGASHARIDCRTGHGKQTDGGLTTVSRSHAACGRTLDCAMPTATCLAGMRARWLSSPPTLPL